MGVDLPRAGSALASGGKLLAAAGGEASPHPRAFPRLFPRVPGHLRTGTRTVTAVPFARDLRRLHVVRDGGDRTGESQMIPLVSLELLISHRLRANPGVRPIEGHAEPSIAQRPQECRIRVELTARGRYFATSGGVLLAGMGADEPQTTASREASSAVTRSN